MTTDPIKKNMIIAVLCKTCSVLLCVGRGNGPTGLRPSM